MSFDYRIYLNCHDIHLHINLHKIGCISTGGAVYRRRPNVCLSKYFTASNIIELPLRNRGSVVKELILKEVDHIA